MKALPEPARPKRRGRITALGLVWLALAWVPVLANPTPDDLPPDDTVAPLESSLGPEDRQTLERIFRESRVETARSRPGLGLYLRDASEALGNWAAGLVERYLARFGQIADGLLRIFSILLFVCLALLVLLVLLRTYRRWQQDLEPPIPSAVRTTPAAETPRRSAKDWEAAVYHHLEDGDLSAALEALWWWLANALDARRAEPSWTSRELITQARRLDLTPQVRRLDRMIYGPDAHTKEDLLGLFQELREATA